MLSNPRPEAQLTEEEDRSLAWTAAVLGRRWKSYLADADARGDYSGLGLSQYTIGKLRTVVAKLGPAGVSSRSRGAPTDGAPWEWRGRAKEPLPADLEGKVIGNKRSHVYHQPGCPNAASMSPANRVPFDTAEAARKAGYRPAKDCHPG